MHDVDSLENSLKKKIISNFWIEFLWSHLRDVCNHEDNNFLPDDIARIVLTIFRN